MNRRQHIALLAGLACAATGLSGPAHAQAAWPSGPVKIIVPVAPGGSADRLARLIGDALGKALDQSFVVENISGGGGIIATQRIARSKGDSHVFMLSYSATHSTNPAVRSVPYDPVADFAPIAMIGGTPNVLVISKAVPAKDLNEFIELARKSPNKFSYGSAGAGTLTHLAMEQFKQATGTDIVHVPYRGGSPLMAALLGDQIHTGSPSLSTAIAQIRAGSIKALAVTSNQRHPLLPDVPTLVEAGLAKEGSFQWYGFHGPDDMPADAVRRLNQAINQAVAADALAQSLAHDGIEVMPMSPEAFGDFVKRDQQTWAALAKTAKISLD